MKQNHDLLADIQIDLNDSIRFDEMLTMLTDLVQALNLAGRVNEALNIQQALVTLETTKRSILAIPNAGWTYRMKNKS